jgi:integrase
VAEQKLREVVREKEQERAGILAPKLERESAMKPLALHLKDFIADLKIKGRAERYYKGVQSNVTRLLKDLGWKLPIDITANDFVQWRSQQTVKPKTLNEYLNAMSTFLSWMTKQERISYHPLRMVEKVDIRGKQQKRRAITDDEFRRLLNVSQDYYLLYLSAVYTGLRLGELSGLTWFDVKLEEERPHIHVPAHLTKNRLQAVVPLHPRLVSALKNEHEGKERTETVFPYYKNPDRRFQRHRKEAGIETIDDTGRKLDFHSFRYTFATKLARKGVSQRLTQELMRHSDPRLTANLYTDVSQLPTFEAVQDLDWFESEPKRETGEASLTRPQIRPQNGGIWGHSLSQTVSWNGANEETLEPLRTKEKTANPCGNGGHKDGRGDRIRTCDICVPNAALYQAELLPDQ